MFNQKLHREMVRKHVERGTFLGRPVKFQKDIYEILAPELGVDVETVKSWTERSSSGGPDPKITGSREKLENLLGLSEGALTIASPMDEKEERKVKLGDFEKKMVMDCYEAMLDHVSDMNIEDEDSFCSVLHLLEKRRMVIPEALYKKMVDFFEETFGKYIYDEPLPLPEFTEDEAEVLENGTIHIKTEAAMVRQLAFYMEQLSKFEREIQNFGNKELKPYLVG